MPLTSVQVTQIRDALLDGYAPDELRELVKLGLDENLHDIVSDGSNQRTVVFELIQWAERHNRVLDLIQAAREENVGNEALAALYVESQSWTDLEPPIPGKSPFKGMVYFDVEDAERFFGRERVTAELVDYLADHPFLAIIGASGSGKSSLVRAGLIPALLDGQPLAESAEWRIHIVTPTAQPIKALAISLTRESESTTATTTLMDDLATDPRSLEIYIHRLLARSDAPKQLLILIDQFEELFTLCRSREERHAFVENLLTAAGVVQLDQEPQEAAIGRGRSHLSSHRVHIVLTLRADFYAHCAEIAALRVALERYQKYIGAMTQEEMRRAIEGPAGESWDFQPGLVAQMLEDVGYGEGREPEPGSLPLLAHALAETWEARSGQTLTLAGYRSVGGVQGAIAQSAENLLADLDADEQAIARTIFLRLTELGEGSQDTRRRVSLDELLSLRSDDAAMKRVIQLLVDKRLVVTSSTYSGSLAGEAPENEQLLQDSRSIDADDLAYIEVAHEALIRRWPRLKQWLDEDQEGLRIERQLREAAQQWKKEECDPGLLYRGVQLMQTLEWIRRQNSGMTILEREFLALSETTLAQTEWIRGDLSYAQTHLEEAVELAPHLPHGHFALFDYLLETAQFDDAMEAYRRLLVQAGTEYRLLPEDLQVDSIVAKDRLGLRFIGQQESRTSLVSIMLTPPTPTIDTERFIELQRRYIEIDSPYISHYLAIDRHGERYYLVTEFIEGELLEHYLKRENIQAQEAFAILNQIALGLEDAHMQGLPHLALNPSNILQTDRGPVLISYGEEWLAKTFLPQITRTSIPSSEGYIAPEQYIGKFASFASDIYAFGALVSRFFIGQTPAATTYLQFAKKTGLEEALLILITRACSPEPGDRYATIKDMRNELQRIANTQWLNDKRNMVQWGLGRLTHSVTWIRSTGVRIFFVLLLIFATFAELWPSASMLLPVTRAILAAAFTVYPASLLFAWQAREGAQNSGHASLVLNGSGMGVVIGLLSVIWTVQNSAVDHTRIGFNIGLLSPSEYPLFIIMVTIITLIFVLFTTYLMRLGGRITQRVQKGYLSGFYGAFFVICLLLLMHSLGMWFWAMDAMLKFSA